MDSVPHANIVNLEKKNSYENITPRDMHFYGAYKQK